MKTKTKIKIRIGNYKTARIIDFILRSVWWGLLKRGISFDLIEGLDYEGRPIDTYYLIELR